MRQLKPIFVAIFLIIPLAACMKAPTLEERLSGKSGAERDRELYYACLERSRYSVPGGHDGAYIGHESRQWVLCDEMNKLNQPVEN